MCDEDVVLGVETAPREREARSGTSLPSAKHFGGSQGRGLGPGCDTQCWSASIKHKDSPGLSLGPGEPAAKASSLLFCF